jgi:parallel beta-helix repeat protein
MRKGLLFILSFSLIFLLVVGVASASTLYVGPTQKYKTIQSAINVAKNGDSIQVAYSTYNEHLMIVGKRVYLTGSNYPKIYGATFQAGGTGQLYGFGVTKAGVSISDGGNNIIRNCAFTNCGLGIFTGPAANNQILNNKFTYGGIAIGDSQGNVIQGNYIYKAPIGLRLFNGGYCKSVTQNTYSNCKIAVQMEAAAGNWMINNKYINNIVNFKITA